MADPHSGDFASHWREIVSGFLKLGLTTFGGPAIMGIMQAELQERRQWVSRDRFVEGLSLADIAVFFLQVGALTFGGGLTMIAFIEEHVVNQFHWITHQDLLGGLALGQLTPGPIVTVAAYVGYKVAGIAGAAVAAVAIFAPSFILTLSVLPIFERVRGLAWTKAAMEGVGPAVIGALAVSLVRLAPHALPDAFAITLLAGALVALLSRRINRRIGTMKLMLAGGILGILRSRLTPLAGIRVPLA